MATGTPSYNKPKNQGRSLNFDPGFRPNTNSGASEVQNGTQTQSARTLSSNNPGNSPINSSGFAQQQNKDRAIKKALAKINAEKTSFRKRLIDGNLLDAARRLVPGIDMLFSRMERAAPETRLKLLQRCRRTLRAAQTIAGLIDGFRSWVTIFGATLPTIVLPVFFLFLLLPWLLIYSLFGKTLGGLLSVAVEKIITIVEELIHEAKESVQKKNLKQKALLQLQQLRAERTA